MHGRFGSPQEWIKDCRETVKQDLDNLILFTGPEGVGKSTLAYQIMRAIDPTFDITRVFFTVDDFIASAQNVSRGRARMADEMLVNHRKGMHGTTLRLLDHLQVCRGLNTHMAICFPHESMFDGAILNFRVRWKVHIPRRGLWILSERQARKWKNRRGEEETSFVWTERGRWTFAANKGQEWDAYLAAKETHMRANDEANAETKPDLGFDYPSLVVAFRLLKDQYANRSGSSAAIQEIPEA